MINAIQNIGSIAMPNVMTPLASSGGSGEFGNMLAGTISTLESMQKDASTSVQQFLTGENEDVHTTVLATQKAELAFQLGMQVKNKVVSAYQEIMKMQL